MKRDSPSIQYEVIFTAPTGSVESGFENPEMTNYSDSGNSITADWSAKMNVISIRKSSMKTAFMEVGGGWIDSVVTDKREESD